MCQLIEILHLIFLINTCLMIIYSNIDMKIILRNIPLGYKKYSLFTKLYLQSDIIFSGHSIYIVC